MSITSLSGFRVNNFTAQVARQNANAKLEEKQQEQKIQEQKVSNQDMSKGENRTQTQAVAYSFLNGKVQTTTKPNDNRSKNVSKQANGNNNTSQTSNNNTEEISTKNKTTWFIGNAYSNMAQNPLSKGLTLSQVGKGIVVDDIDEKDDDNIDSFDAKEGETSSNPFTKSAQRDAITFISMDLKYGYANKIGIRNQDNPILAKARSLSSMVVNGYKDIGLAMADVQ